MRPLVTLRPAADQDLNNQADYLAREASLEIALRFYDAAHQTFELLAAMPNIGEHRPSTNPRLKGMRVSRIEGFPNHLVFYRPTERGIEIIRVLHGGRDIEAVLNREASE